MRTHAHARTYTSRRLGEQTDTVKIFRSFAPDEPYVLVNGTPASILSAVLAYGFPYVVRCLCYKSRGLH
jgi:hypothetical protein